MLELLIVAICAGNPCYVDRMDSGVSIFTTDTRHAIIDVYDVSDKTTQYVMVWPVEESWFDKD